MRMEGRELRRKAKDRGDNKRTSCGPNSKHAESGTEAVYIPNPRVWLLRYLYPSLQLPLIVVLVVLLLFRSESDLDIPYTSPQDKSLA